MEIILSQGVILSFGLRAYNGPQPRHLGARSFVPVFERVEPVEYRDIWSGKHIVKDEPRYKRGGWNFFTVQSTQKVRFMWAMVRVKRAKAGQLKLF